MAGRTLTREQLVAIETLRAHGKSVRQIAKEVGCNPGTVQKHVSDPNFAIKLPEVREAFKRQSAVKSLEVQQGTYRLAQQAIQKGNPFALKAATGAAKDLDQINSVATGDTQQAGVASPPPTPVDLKVLIANFIRDIDSPHRP